MVQDYLQMLQYKSSRFVVSITLNKSLFISVGFCSCTEGYTLMEELQDCVQFSDNGKKLFTSIIA